MSIENKTKDRLDRIRANIRDYPDFPKPGILFRSATLSVHFSNLRISPPFPCRDVFPLFYQPSLLDDVISLMEQHIRQSATPVDAVVGLESRGFLIGPTLALRLGVAFIPIRKAGKLPGDVRR